MPSPWVLKLSLGESGLIYHEMLLLWYWLQKICKSSFFSSVCVAIFRFEKILFSHILGEISDLLIITPKLGSELWIFDKNDLKKGPIKKYFNVDAQIYNNIHCIMF